MPATHSKLSRVAESLVPLLVPLDRLEPLPRNLRRGVVAAVERSYQRFGQRKPIVMRRIGGTKAEPRGVVLAGNHQLLAARELGWPLPRQEQRASRLVAPGQPTVCGVRVHRRGHGRSSRRRASHPRGWLRWPRWEAAGVAPRRQTARSLPGVRRHLTDVALESTAYRPYRRNPR